jgi:hypothetical protein
MTNDEVAELARVPVMTFPKSGDIGYKFVIRHSSLIRHSGFAIRHFREDV